MRNGKISRVSMRLILCYVFLLTPYNIVFYYYTCIELIKTK